MIRELEAAPLAAAPTAELAAHLRLPEGFEDPQQAATLDLYARAATAAVEALCGRALIARKF